MYLTVKDKDRQACYSNKESAESRRTTPGVGGTSPGEPYEEENTPSNEEEDANKVQFLKHLPFCFALDMQLGISRWVVEEVIQHSGNDGKNKTDIVAPAPALTRVLDQQSCNDRAEYGKWEGGHENDRDYHAAVLVGHQLAQDDAKGQLTGRREAVENVGNNQHLDVGGSCSHNAANDGQYHGSLHDPFPTKYVRQSADQKESDAARQRPDGSNPVDIGRIAQFRVDQGQRIGGQDPAQVGHDGS